MLKQYCKKIVTNKVVLYLVTRYMTYAVQFITSIWVAVKLGPFYLGIWGVILLLINYFKLINFPIFNVADIYVTVAAFFFIILGLFYYKEEDYELIFPDKNKKKDN